MHATGHHRGSPRLALLLGATALLAVPAGARAGGPRHPFPQHVVYAAGSAGPEHRSQLQLDDDVRALHAAWKARYLAQAGVEPDGHPRYRVRVGRDAGAATVSEGQGYGMVIAALMAGHDPAARTVFDGLFEFVLDHPSEIDARLMDWRVAADEIPEPGGNDSAFDGDADIAYALLLAERQWGNTGRFDYGAAARQVLAGLLASAIGPDSRLPLLGDWVDPQGSPYSQLTPRVSDFLPDHFRAFAMASEDPAWDAVRSAVSGALEAVQTTHAPVTGLVPDFLEPVSASDPSLRPADAYFLEGPNDGAYYYNALRVPLRLGIAALVADDAASRVQASRISLWVEQATGGDPALVRAGYALDGAPLAGSDYFTSAFAAPVGVAAMSVPGQQAWLAQLYDAVRLSDEGYYEDTMSLLGLLVMSGNYWSPTTFAATRVPALSWGGRIALVTLLAGFASRRLAGIR